MAMNPRATEADHAAAYDMKTLIEAEKIRKDPQRYKAAMAKFQEAYSAMNAVAKGKAPDAGGQSGPAEAAAAVKGGTKNAAASAAPRRGAAPKKAAAGKSARKPAAGNRQAKAGSSRKGTMMEAYS